MSHNSSIEEEFLKRLTELTEANLTNEQFGVSELAREMNMSRSNLHRKVVAITKTSVSQFIRQYRLKRAMEMLQQTALTISEVAYNVGFGSVTYFTKSFHDYYGFPPGEVGKRNLIEPNANEQAIDATQVKSSKRFRIVILLISLLGIIIATGPFIVFKPSSLGKNRLEKTIAVLPFVNYSPEEGTTYIINGLQEEILDKLEKINELKVKSRTAVEKYKDTKLSISDIAKDLKVNYILEGSGQKINDKIRIRLQLIETTSGNHLWSKPYEEEVSDNTIFEIQEEVALRVANELKAVITPDEKTAVIKKPTQNLAAYNYYLQGLEYLKLNNLSWSSEEVKKAKKCFEQAIRLDSTFAEAYVRLAHCYLSNTGIFTINDSTQKIYQDSGFMMANKALLYDNKNAWAYSIRGDYFLKRGMPEKAEEEYAKAEEEYEKVDKNEAYHVGYYEGMFWRNIGKKDYYNAFANFYMCQEFKPEEPGSARSMMSEVTGCLIALGYLETAKKYAREVLNQYNDSVNYFYCMAEIKRQSGNYKNAIKYDLKIHEADTSNIYSLYDIIRDEVQSRDLKTAYKYLLEMEDYYSKVAKEFSPGYLAGYVYLKNGDFKKAEHALKYGFNINAKDTVFNTNEDQQRDSKRHLGTIYAIWGEKNKALKYLKAIEELKSYDANLITLIKHNPMLDNIRNEPEFVNILNRYEAKHKKEILRIGKLLKEHGDLE